jgi:hypothetical protein
MGDLREPVGQNGQAKTVSHEPPQYEYDASITLPSPSFEEPFDAMGANDVRSAADGSRAASNLHLSSETSSNVKSRSPTQTGSDIAGFKRVTHDRLQQETYGSLYDPLTTSGGHDQTAQSPYALASDGNQYGALYALGVDVAAAGETNPESNYAIASDGNIDGNYNIASDATYGTLPPVNDMEMLDDTAVLVETALDSNVKARTSVNTTRKSSYLDVLPESVSSPMAFPHSHRDLYLTGFHRDDPRVRSSK